jgi:hypothetical protein
MRTNVCMKYESDDATLEELWEISFSFFGNSELSII